MRILGVRPTFNPVEAVGGPSEQSVRDGYAAQGYTAQSCGNIKKAQCAAKVAGVVGICADSLGVACLAAIGSLGDCCDCLPSQYRHYC